MNTAAKNPSALQSLGLPPMDQIGFVVRDLDAWVARYDALFGPFSFMDGSVADANYRGRSEDAELKLAFGRSGELEIEFIEWLGGHSPHSEFIEAGKEGMHHIRYRVDNTDAWIEKLGTVGFKPIWYKRWSADTVFAYLENPNDPLIVELLQMPAGGPGA